MATFNENEMARLRNQLHQGYAQRSVPRYEWRGAGRDGRSRRQVGYDSVINYEAYNDGVLGKARDAVGIKNVNSTDEVRRIHDYIAGYKPPAPPAPKPKAAPKPAPKPISNPYKAQADKLMKTIKQMETNQTQKIAEIQEAAKARITYATPQAVQPANLTISAAGSQPKQTGSSTFKRRSMKSPSTSNLRTINSVNI